jgi:hypothetical protein
MTNYLTFEDKTQFKKTKTNAICQINFLTF